MNYKKIVEQSMPVTFDSVGMEDGPGGGEV